MYYNEAGADELVFLDISKTEEGHSLMLEVIEQTASRLFIPHCRVGFKALMILPNC